MKYGNYWRRWLPVETGPGQVLLCSLKLRNMAIGEKSWAIVVCESAFVSAWGPRMSRILGGRKTER